MANLGWERRIESGAGAEEKEEEIGGKKLRIKDRRETPFSLIECVRECEHAWICVYGHTDISDRESEEYGLVR